MKAHIARKYLSVILAFIIVFGIIPVYSQSLSVVLEPVNAFGWNFTRNQDQGEIKVVSWDDNRSVFLLFKLPDGFTFDSQKQEALAQIMAYSTLPNGAGGATTATILAVNGEDLYNTNNQSGFMKSQSLNRIKRAGSYVGTMATGTQNANISSSVLNLSTYLDTNKTYIGLFLTNRQEDNYYKYGITILSDIKLKLEIKDKIQNTSRTFTWAWDKHVAEKTDKADVVSWQGGEKQSYRSSFVVFDLPEDFTYDPDFDTINANFAINNATLPNGAGQAPTACVMLVCGDLVKEATSTLPTDVANPSISEALLNIIQDGIYIGSYKIDSEKPSGNLISFDLTQYLAKYEGVQSIGFYLTNLERDNYGASAAGIATNMSSFSLTYEKISSDSVLKINLVDEDGNLLKRITHKGNAGDTVDLTSLVSEKISAKNNIYKIGDNNPASFELSSGINEIDITYSLFEQNTVLISNIGHSGPLGRTGIIVGVAGGDANGDENRAPAVSGQTVSGNATFVASNRIGVLSFDIDTNNIDINQISEVELNLYINDVNENLYTGWLRLAAYETNNPVLTYSVGDMDASLYPQKDNDYSINAAFWSKNTISRNTRGYVAINVRDAVVNAILKNEQLGANKKDVVTVVLRLQVPIAAVYIHTNESDPSCAPYVKIKYAQESLVLDYDFEEDGQVLDKSPNRYNGTLLGSAKVEGGKLIVEGNGGVQINHTGFRDKLSSYTIMTTITPTKLLENSRIYDFGAASTDSGFLRVKEFAVGLKYRNQTTILATYNQDPCAYFDTENEKYHIAVTYDQTTTTTKVYINGTLSIVTNDIKYSLNAFSNRFSARNFIGRTNWYDQLPQENPDIWAIYDDFKVYSTAFPQRVIQNMYIDDFSQELDEAYEAVADEVSQYEGGYITQNLSLPFSYKTQNGTVFKVEWKSSNENVVTNSGVLLRQSLDETVTLRGRVYQGDYSKELSITFTVGRITDDEILDNLVLRYDFEDSGTIIYDKSNNENHGEATNELVQKYNVANIKDNAIIKMPNDIHKDITDYTIMAWIRPDDLTREGQRIYDIGNIYRPQGPNGYAFLRVNPTGTLSVGVNNGGQTQIVTSEGRVSEKQWNHVAVAYSASDCATYIYINGGLDTISYDITNTIANVGSTTTSNLIGRSQWFSSSLASTNRDFFGKIDNFEFYNVTLSASSIVSRMNEPFSISDFEYIDSTYIDGANLLRIYIGAQESLNGAKVIAAEYSDESYKILTQIKSRDINIRPGLNLIDVDITKQDGHFIKFYIWESYQSLVPIELSGYEKETVRVISSPIELSRADSHLLNTQFYLKSYAHDKYASASGANIVFKDWQDGDNTLLWTGEFNYQSTIEGYFYLKNVATNSYISSNARLGSSNSWRIENVNGLKNVFTIKASNGNYLCANASGSVYLTTQPGEESYWEIRMVKRDAFANMLISPGFLRLSPHEQQRLYDVTSQPLWLSSNRKSTLLGRMGSNYNSLSAVEQEEILRSIFSYTPTSQINRSVNKDTTGYKTTYSIGEITEATYGEWGTSGNLNGYTAVVVFNNEKTGEPEHTVRVYARSRNVINNFAEAFSCIPYEFRRFIKTVIDSYNTANQFNAGADAMYIRTSYEVSASGIAMTGAHELGHSLSATSGWWDSKSTYTSAMNNDIFKVSGYGATNSAEDFAEFTQLVISCLNRPYSMEAVKIMFPNRFEALVTLMRSYGGGTCILDKFM